MTAAIPTLDWDSLSAAEKREHVEAATADQRPTVKSDAEMDELFASPTKLKIELEELHAELADAKRQIANLRKYNAAQKQTIADLETRTLDGALTTVRAELAEILTRVERILKPA